MYLGLYLNVSVFTLRQPKLSLLCYGCSPLVEILRLFAIFVKFLNGLFIFMKLQRMYCMCTFTPSSGVSL